MADEELSNHYRKRFRWSVAWYSWVFGIAYEPGANVWSSIKGTGLDVWYEDNQLLEYPRMVFIHLGPFTLNITGSIPKKREWQS
jgi:hypothetical protein